MTSTPAPGVPAGGAPIFDPRVLHDARIEIDPSAWQALRENFQSNQYYAANFSVDGVAVAQVGIRSRGDGSRSEEKPGLKVDFNKYVPVAGVLRLQDAGDRQPDAGREHAARAARVPGVRGDGDRRRRATRTRGSR